MKKGFTLIELIVTIGLICILGTVIVANMANNLSEQQERQYEKFKNTLENATCTYIELNKMKDFKRNCRSNGSCIIKINEILEEGLIEESDLVSPKTQEKISTESEIEITYPDGIKTCKYKE